MAVYPYSRLFITPEHIVALSGPHIQVVNIVTGDILHSTTRFSDEQKDAVLTSGPIRCAAVDKSFKYLITAGDDKMLKVWELNGLKFLSKRELPKKPTVLEFTSNGETLLAADKFGDIFSYPFTHVPLTTKQNRDALSSHENPSGGTLILGHASPLNAFLLSPSEKFIITADRDEHIRVSWYPQGYNIEMYCLGHRKFVSAIHIPPSDPTRLISGGGDPMLKIWDWMAGQVVHEVSIAEVVDPFMVVRVAKRKRGGHDDDPPENGRQKRKRKGKGKGKERPEAQNVEKAVDDVKLGQEETPVEPKAEKVLVIHKIDSLESESGKHILFSAVGTSALFAFPYMPTVQSSEIRHFDFGKPVVDFSVGDDARIWVSLDGEWETETGGEDKRLVRVVKMVNGELIEIEQMAPIIAALNSVCPPTATADNLKKLDLYNDLTSMPKYAEVENDSGDEEAEGDNIDLDEGKAKDGAPKSKKELGRLKSQQAVARVLEQAVGGSEAKHEENNADVEASKRKRIKPDARDEADIVMG